MTAQVADSISIDGVTHSLCVLPLESLFKVMSKPPHFIPPSSANWRGYVASWKIEGDRLLLVGVRGQLESKDHNSDERYRQARIEDSSARWQSVVSRIEGLAQDSFGIRQSTRNWFGWEIESENGHVEIELASGATTEQILNSDAVPLSAAWYSGLLRVPLGEELEYVHGGFHSVYETDLVIEVNAGTVGKQWLIDNKPGHEERKREGKAQQGSFTVKKKKNDRLFRLAKHLALNQKAIDSVSEEQCSLCSTMSLLDRPLFRATLNRLPMREAICDACLTAFWRNQSFLSGDE